MGHRSNAPVSGDGAEQTGSMPPELSCTGGDKVIVRSTGCKGDAGSSSAMWACAKGPASVVLPEDAAEEVMVLSSVEAAPVAPAGLA